MRFWKRQILKVSFRQKKISDFVNGDGDENDFIILDSIAKSYPDSVFREEFKSQTSFSKALWYKADGLFYLAMIFVNSYPFTFDLNRQPPFHLLLYIE